MRAARLIKMVLLLQSRPLMTAAELAQELEVSERTITRDALALSEAGIPVYAERGRTGGYRLIGGYRAVPQSLKGLGGAPITGMARIEAETLFLSGVPGALRQMGLADAASAARLKVSAALLPSLRDASAAASQRFHLDAPGWYQEPVTPELLPSLADAVWSDRQVSAQYRRRDGSEVRRDLEPYGLVLKAGVWYVCARADGDFRVYRIDRFTGVALHDGDRFIRDEDFDLPAFWEQQAAAFSRSILRTEVELRLSESGAARLPYTVDRTAAAEALAAAGPADALGRVTVTLPVESLDVAYGQLLALGPEVEVLGPPELRDRVAGAMRRGAELYR